jgi:hypothetical protein
MADAYAISGVDQTLIAGPAGVAGWSFRETAGAVAAVRLRDGTVSGEIFAAVSLPANGSHAVMLTRALYFPTAVFVDIVSGAVEGAVWVE